MFPDIDTKGPLKLTRKVPPKTKLIATLDTYTFGFRYSPPTHKDLHKKKRKFISGSLYSTQWASLDIIRVVIKKFIIWNPRSDQYPRVTKRQSYPPHTP